MLRRVSGRRLVHVRRWRRCGRDRRAASAAGADRRAPAPQGSRVIREALKMGDPRLLRIAQPVQDFAAPELQALITDLFDTMRHLDGAGLAAPQIGVDLRVVIFGFARNDRYPDAPAVPATVLINPQLTPLSDELEDGWEVCRSGPGLQSGRAAWREE